VREREARANPVTACCGIPQHIEKTFLARPYNFG
jgi:hypothetical protein